MYSTHVDDEIDNRPGAVSVRLVSGLIHMSYVSITKIGRHVFSKAVVLGILDYIIEMKKNLPHILISHK